MNERRRIKSRKTVIFFLFPREAVLAWFKCPLIDLADTWDNTVSLQVRVDVEQPERRECAPEKHARECVLRFFKNVQVHATGERRVFQDRRVTQSPLSRHWWDDSRGSPPHSQVDLWLWPKCRKPLWCELTARAACGNISVAVWLLMYMLVWLCAWSSGRLRVFGSLYLWATMVARTVYMPNMLSCKKCSRVGWAYFCFSWYSHILKSLKENCESPSQSAHGRICILLIWRSVLIFLLSGQNVGVWTVLCMWLKEQQMDSFQGLFVSLLFERLDKDLCPYLLSCHELGSS